jgi:nitroreductase
MELLESIKARKSIRAFKPDSIPTHILFDLLGVATRAPSSVNLQPWEFFIVTGEALKEIKNAYVEQLRLGIEPHPEIYFYKIRSLAPVMEGIYKERQVTLAKQMFKLLGVAKEDKKRLQEFYERMYRFYDASTIIIIIIDKILLQGSWFMFDIGLVTQNIVLLAQEYGLGTCIMRAIVDYPDQIRKIVEIPHTKQIIIGIAIGYPDWDHPINQLKTEREILNNIVIIADQKRA